LCAHYKFSKMCVGEKFLRVFHQAGTFHFHASKLFLSRDVRINLDANPE
jgi:hypothetical protein